MPLFEYSGFNASGKKSQRRHRGARARMQLLQKLRSQGIFPSSLREEREAHMRDALPWREVFRRKVPALQTATATRQLAILLGAGLPLGRGLGVSWGSSWITRCWPGPSTEPGRMSFPARRFIRPLENQGIFSKLFTSMVQVGENTGRLEQVLGSLADFLEEQAQLRSKIQAALAYPILMTLICACCSHLSVCLCHSQGDAHAG